MYLDGSGRAYGSLVWDDGDTLLTLESGAYNEVSFDANRDLRKKVEEYRACFTALCPDKPLPFCKALVPLLPILDIVTPNIKAKATLWASNQGTSGKGSQSHTPSKTSSKGVKLHSPGGGLNSPPVKLRTCKICQKTKDQVLKYLKHVSFFCLR